MSTEMLQELLDNGYKDVIGDDEWPAYTIQTMRGGEVQHIVVYLYSNKDDPKRLTPEAVNVRFLPEWSIPIALH